MADISVGDHTIRRHMPQPVAVAWQRVHLETGAAGRLRRATATLEVVLRTLSALALADYLRGPPDPRVEELLGKLGRPTTGIWMALAREAVRAVSQREDPEPFIPEWTASWFDSKGRPRKPLKLLESLVSLRNDAAHGTGVGGGTVDAEQAGAMVAGLRDALGGLDWALRYRLLRVLDQQPTRASSTRGRVQLLAGQALDEPVAAEWTARLFSDAVYLASPVGDRLLEVSPLVDVRVEPQLGQARPFVLASIHKSGDPVLACDETGHTEVVRIDDGSGPRSFAAWLEDRASRSPAQHNEDRAGTLASTLGSGTDATGSLLDGRYALHEQLGEGGMGVVYRATDQVTGVDLAVKVMREEVGADPEIRARFKREGTTMAGMRHPSVLSGASVGQADDGTLYLTMPLLTGGTVADRIRDGAVTEADRARWTRELLDALIYLGSRGVVHRDVKPSNLLLDADGHAVLADFGIALGASDARLTRTLSQLGSLAYMPPEGRTGVLDVHGDAYSAAVVLHELWTGELPRGAVGEGVDGRVGAVIRALGRLAPRERIPVAEAREALDDRAQALSGEPEVGSDDARILALAGISGVPAAVLLFFPALFIADGEPWGWWWGSWAVAVGLWALVGRVAGARAIGSPMGVGAATAGLSAFTAVGYGGILAPLAAASSEAEVPAFGQFETAGADLLTRLLLLSAATVVGTCTLGAVAGAAGAAGLGGARGEARPDGRIRGELGASILVCVLLFGAITGALGELAMIALDEWGDLLPAGTLRAVLSMGPAVVLAGLGIPLALLMAPAVDDVLRREPRGWRWLVPACLVAFAAIAILPALAWAVWWAWASAAVGVVLLGATLEGVRRARGEHVGDAGPRDGAYLAAMIGGLTSGMAVLALFATTQPWAALQMVMLATVGAGYQEPQATGPNEAVGVALLGGVFLCFAWLWAGSTALCLPFMPPRPDRRTALVQAGVGTALCLMSVLPVVWAGAQITWTTSSDGGVSITARGEASTANVDGMHCWHVLNEPNPFICTLLGLGPSPWDAARKPIHRAALEGAIADPAVVDGLMAWGDLPRIRDEELPGLPAWLAEQFPDAVPAPETIPAPWDAVFAARAVAPAPIEALPAPAEEVGDELEELERAVQAGLPGARERVLELAAAHPRRFDVQTLAWVSDILAGEPPALPQRMAMARDLRMRPADHRRVQLALAEFSRSAGGAAESPDGRAARAIGAEVALAGTDAVARDVASHGLLLATVVPGWAETLGGWAQDLSSRRPEPCEDEDPKQCEGVVRLEALTDRFVATADAVTRGAPVGPLWPGLDDPTVAHLRRLPCALELRHALDQPGTDALDVFLDRRIGRCGRLEGRDLLERIARDERVRRAPDPIDP